MATTYWTSVFTRESWLETGRHQYREVGFPESRRSATARIAPGDVLVCYLRGHSAFVGALEVMSSSRMSETPRIWSGGSYPVRLTVRPIVALAEGSAVSVYDLLDRLEFSWGVVSKKQTWGSYFQSPPKRLKQRNAEVIVEALTMRWKEERSRLAHSD